MAKRTKKYNPNKSPLPSQGIISMIYRGGGIKPNKDEQIDIELYCRVNLQSLLAYNSKSAFHNIRVLCDTILVFARQVNNPLLIKMHDRCLKQMQDYDVDAKTTEAERREYFKNLIALINYFCNSIGQYTVKAYTDAGSVAGNHVSKYLFKAIMGEPEQLKQMVKDILNGLSLTQASTKYGLIVEHVKICFYRIVGSLFLLERDFTNMAEPDNLQAVRKSKQRYLDMLDLVGQVAEKAA